MVNLDVVKAWYLGKSAKTANLRTNGIGLWSYELCIGYILSSSWKVAIEYCGKNRVSMTTSKHVSLAMGIAHETVEPNSVHVTALI